MASELANYYKVLPILFLALHIQLLWMTGPNRLLVGATEGGPSSFGYDASSACNKPLNREGRARRLENLPCDFRKESWCTIAGSEYPWHAVRRFVQENQGLMKRMYGDEKHMSVLKNELEKDDVEVEVEGDYNQLYSDDPSSFSPTYRHFSYGYEDDYEPSREEDYELTRVHRARSLNLGTSNKLDSVSRLHSDGTPATVSTASDLPIPSSSSPSSSASILTSTESSSSTTASSTTTTTTISPKSTHRTKILPVSSSTSSSFSSTPSTTTTTTSTTTSRSSSTPQSLNFNEIDRIDRIDTNVDELVETANGTTITLTTDEDDEDETEDYEEDLRVISTSENPGDIPKVVGLEEQISTGNSQPQKFRPRPEYKPTEASKIETSTKMEGQLFQDAAAKDTKQEAVLKVRGINACPTKIEMIAPFWGNSTRGEILALLNLYPFEQYVHYEKCTSENKQMYCRDGCRCEQQYRVHRLLAYDPNNECRGIFSDWFRFPSCCTCHCYDLPLEFRVTSRSPRTNLISAPRPKVKVRPPNPPPPVRRRRRGN